MAAVRDRATDAAAQNKAAVQVDRDRTAQSEEKKKNLTVPLTLELIGIDIEKGGIYRLQLGFQPGATPLPAFEQSLRTDYGGEIEIFLNGKLHKRLRYEDHAGFAPTPVGDGYGPVYFFHVDVPFGGSQQCDLYPKIRAKKPGSYALAISREQQSWGEKIKNFFQDSSKEVEHESDQTIIQRSDLQVLALVECIDIAIEKKGGYGIMVGFHKKEKGKILEFDDRLYKDFSGTIEIFEGDNPYLLISYEDRIAMGYAGYGAKFRGFNYSVDNMNIGWYRFVPIFMSDSEEIFGFTVKRSYMRK